MTEISLDVTILLAAVIEDFGGELSVSPESLQKVVEKDYQGKGIEVTYVPARDVFVLRLDDKEELENENV